MMTFLHYYVINTVPHNAAPVVLCLVQPKPQPKLRDIQPYAALVCYINGLHPCNACKYMDYYSLTDPEGLKAEFA